jgi:membrane complex biogenesis BtpA family protein
MGSPFLFNNCFSIKKPIIAMVHVLPGQREVQLAQALQDAERLIPYVDGLITENYGLGYSGTNTATRATAERICEITAHVELLTKGTNVVVGVNILPNDYLLAFEVAHSTSACFIQMDHVTGEFVGRESVSVHAFRVARCHYSGIAVLGGVHPKYYTLKNPTQSIADSARTAAELADAIVVTGEHTGGATALGDLYSVKAVCPDTPLIIGSGLNEDNVLEQLAVADGAIVGTAFKDRGVVPGEPISVERVKRLMDKVWKLR